MNRIAKYTAVLTFCMLATAFAPAVSADEKSELELKPCTIELVDGTEVAGKLAVQFDLDDHLIVYSPRLATVRSFLKDHVHALTVDGKREELNPKRELTEEDKTLLGQTEWPDEPPAEGFKPAYTTEEWSKPERLLVWANPGKSGRFGTPSNWQANGETLDRIEEHRYMFKKRHGRPETDAAFTPNTDFLIPVSARRYQVRGVAHWRKGSFVCRHVTVETGASFQHNLDGLYGNLWVSPLGSFNGGGNAPFRGSKHTLLRNGMPRAGTDPITDPQKLEAMGLARKWELRKDDPDASMEIIGSAGSGDETHVISGRLIVAENSTVLIGPRCRQTIYKEGVLELHSGAYFGKKQNQPASDMAVRGTLLAGTPDRPLTRDCYLGISCSDWKGHIRELPLPLRGQRSWHSIPESRRAGDPGMHIGLAVPEGAKLRVHSADPTKSRLVIRWHGDDRTGADNGAAFLRIETERQKEMWEQMTGKICAYFGGDVQFDGVLFDHFHKGGIMLADMDMPKKWEHVHFGKHNDGDPDELFAPMPDRLARDDEEQEGDAPVAEITPRHNAYVAGRDTVRVTISSDAEPGTEIRYTTDGSIPDAEAEVYSGPIMLKETTVVKARCFKDGRRLGPPRRREYVFHAPDAIEIEPQETTATAPGLIGTFYKNADRYTNWNVFEKMKPTKRDVVEQLDLALSGGEPAAIAFDGYLTVKRPGMYRFEVVTDYRPQGKNNFLTLTLDDAEIFRDALFRGTDGDTRQAGVARLAPGTYPLHVKALIEGRELQVLWEGPGIEKQPIPTGAFLRQQWWNAAVTPSGGLHEDGETVEVRMSVDTRADASGVTVRYTRDGSEPTGESAAYDKPIPVEKDTTIKARCFRDGEPLPGKPATAKFVFLSGLDEAKPGLVYRLYEGGWSALPAFDELDPAESGTAERIEMDVTDRGSNFGLVFDGYLTVPTAGEYTFYTTSDDGSALYIDGKKVVDNDGAHGMQERSGTVTLSKGPHRIRVEFFQGGGGKGLEVHWNGPGIDKQAIPAEFLKH